MAVLLSCAGHAITFALAANAGSRATVNTSSIAGYPEELPGPRSYDQACQLPCLIDRGPIGQHPVHG